MRTIGTKSLFKFLKVGLALASLQCIPTMAYAEGSLQARNEAYVSEVVGIMRSHVLSMRMILDHDDLRYADIMVRHAEAFQRAFGVVGPMEWHVAESFNYAQKSDVAQKLSEEQFDVVKVFVTPQLSRFSLRHQLTFIVVGAHVTQV